MPLAGALAIEWRETTPDNSASSCDGRGKASRRHPVTSQMSLACTTDFRWKVVRYSPDRTEEVVTFEFNSIDAATDYIGMVMRNEQWAQIEGVGL